MAGVVGLLLHGKEGFVTEELHRPVLVPTVLAHLAPAPGQVFVDATFGAGGHALAILGSLRPGGLLVGLDRDAEILEAARARWAGETDVRLFHARASELPAVLDELGLAAVDGVLLDLGVSSYQLGRPERGFSFLAEGPLDMRMDREGQDRTAADLVNRLPASELAELFFRYGEERASRRIAAAIERARGVRPIETTTELAELVRSALGRHRGRIDPATRVFQALRIAVNRELEELEAALPRAMGRLAPGGRLGVISFHSLEDRIVKNAFRDAARRGGWILESRKPIFAGEDEVAANPRARSARLRVLVREGGSAR